MASNGITNGSVTATSPLRDNRLAGKIAVVTGASSGLGRAISLKFASAGARIVCADLQPGSRAWRSKPPTPTHEEIQKHYGQDNAIFVQTDATKESEIEALVAKAVEWGGRLDIMCNNAGIATEVEKGLSLRIHDTPTENYDRTHAINQRGVWIGCKYAIKQMLAQEPRQPNARGDRPRGWIINTASMLGLVGMHNGPCYVPTKHAVVGITRQIAIDYAKDRIHCNCLCPGFVKSAMIDDLIPTDEHEQGLADAHPWGTLGRPEDVADVALFLASDEASWVTGHPMVVGTLTCCVLLRCWTRFANVE